MAEFIQLLAVAEQAVPDCYVATIIADTDGDGAHET